MLWGVILVMFFFWYDRALKNRGTQLNISSIKTTPSLQNILIFIWSCALFLINTIALFRLWKNKKIWLQMGIGRLLLWIGWLITQEHLAFLNSAVVSYILLASAEELLKFSRGHSQSLKHPNPSVSNLLLYSLLIGFSFSLAENFLARWSLLSTNQSLSSSILRGRGLLTTMLHCLATGSIAYIFMHYQDSTSKSTTILKTTLGLTTGFILHSSYNLALYFWQGRIGILLAVSGFFGLTYLLFHLDELYLSNNKSQSWS